jgi:hypothetical protein
MTGGTKFGILILLVLVSLAYVAASVGKHEASSALEPKPSIAAVVVKPPAGGGALRTGNASGASPAPSGYFPSGYVNQGRDGDGNVMTYEHD